MFALILGILVIGALLSVIFGKSIGALFATSAISVVLGGVLLCLIAVGWLFFFGGGGASQTTNNNSDFNYGSNHNTNTISGSSTSNQTYAPNQTSAPVTQAPASTYQAPTYQTPAPTTGPRMGFESIAVPPSAAYYMNQLFAMPLNGGVEILEVYRGQSADTAGLLPCDLVLSINTQGQQAAWVTPSNTTNGFLDRVGYNVPVQLHIYRTSTNRDFWVWVHPR